MSVSSLVHGDGKFSPPRHRAISLVRTVHAGLHLGHDASIAIVADDLLLLVLEVRAQSPLELRLGLRCCVCFALCRARVALFGLSP